MDFDLTEELLAIVEAAREFAKAHLLAGVIEQDIEAEFPKERTAMIGN